MDRINYKLLILVAATLLFFGRGVNAAIIHINIPSNLKVGDEVTVPITLDTEGQEINAIDIGVLYPHLLNVSYIDKYTSEIQLWVNGPSYTKDVIWLRGGTPSGMNGSNIIIAKAVFSVATVGQGALGFTPSSVVLLNDGQATKARLELDSPGFTINPSKPGSVNKTPEPSPTNDKSKPQSFSIYIDSDPRVFQDQKFVSFFATDTGTGIDHYELKEGSGSFRIVKSPYLLKDQSLHSVITVRAYDGSGNYREAKWPNIWIRIWWWILGLFRK